MAQKASIPLLLLNQTTYLIRYLAIMDPQTRYVTIAILHGTRQDLGSEIGL